MRVFLQRFKVACAKAVCRLGYHPSVMIFKMLRCSFFNRSMLGFLTFLGLILGSGSVQALDLLQAWAAAKAKDPQLSIAKYQLQAVNERVEIARSTLAPNLSASGNVSRQNVDSNKDLSRQFTSQVYGLNLNYPLYRRPATEALEQSRLVGVQTEIQSNFVQQDLLIRVTQAYTDVLAAQDSLRAAQSQRKAAREQFNVVKKSFDAGAAARLDLQDATARADISQAQEVAARNDLLIKRSNLQVLTGIADFELQRLKPTMTIAQPQPLDADAWVRQARASNLLVQQAEIGAEIAKREVAKQEAGHRPTLDFVGSVGRTNNASVNFIGVNQNTAQLGLQLNLPIYSGGGLDARSREAVALYGKAASELENVREQSEQSVRQSFVRLNSGRALVQALEVAVQSSVTALEVTQQGFQGGARVNIDVLNAVQQVFNTRRDLARARYDLLLDSLKLKQAAGSLTQDDLAALNSLLQPLGAESAN
jgi:outer membrane protein